MPRFIQGNVIVHEPCLFINLIVCKSFALVERLAFAAQMHYVILYCCICHASLHRLGERWGYGVIVLQMLSLDYPHGNLTLASIFFSLWNSVLKKYRLWAPKKLILLRCKPETTYVRLKCCSCVNGASKSMGCWPFAYSKEMQEERGKDECAIQYTIKVLAFL